MPRFHGRGAGHRRFFGGQVFSTQRLNIGEKLGLESRVELPYFHVCVLSLVSFPGGNADPLG